jgi:hypothetical protein
MDNTKAESVNTIPLEIRTDASNILNMQIVIVYFSYLYCLRDSVIKILGFHPLMGLTPPYC